MSSYYSMTCERGLHDVCSGFSPVSGDLCCCTCECRTRIDKERDAATAGARNRALLARAAARPIDEEHEDRV